jgi:hypothetical protein
MNGEKIASSANKGSNQNTKLLDEVGLKAHPATPAVIPISSGISLAKRPPKAKQNCAENGS